MAAEFFLSVSLSYVKGYLTCPKILKYTADGLTSPPKEAVLHVFITIRNSSLSAGLKLAILGSSGKHDKCNLLEHNMNYQNLPLCSHFVPKG
jgi:hypothetical protein